MPSALLEMRDFETAGLNWHYTLAERVWEKARAMGIGISVWTVNDPAQQRLWLDRQKTSPAGKSAS